MSRPLRIEYQDAWYHLMNRGWRAETIFSEKIGDNDQQIDAAIDQTVNSLSGCR